MTIPAQILREIAAEPDYPAVSEACVREMRDYVFGYGTQKNWDALRGNWMEPETIRWLAVECLKMLEKEKV